LLKKSLQGQPEMFWNALFLLHGITTVP
jgi:hypothetical protein